MRQAFRSFASLFRDRKNCKKPEQKEPELLTFDPQSIKDPRLLRYIACMVLGGVGDCFGFRNGLWEFERNGELIHKQVSDLGGLEHLSPKDFKVSDDTIMLIATAQGLISYEFDKKDRKDSKNKSPEDEKADLYLHIASAYVACMGDMMGRAPGGTCIRGAALLRPDQRNGYIIPFNPEGGGCGGAMRSMCIGLRYPSEEEEDELIAVSIESGRMTHNCPTGYLGSLASALFTAFALRGVDMNDWGRKLVTETLPRAHDYIQKTGRDLEENEAHWAYFVDAWNSYLELRHLKEGGEPVFPEEFGIKERDQFYIKISARGWGGASGHDSPMIAYDALLAAKGNWTELCNRAIFHGGDSDSTGTIAGCWFGAIYGFDKVPPSNYDHLEKLGTLVKIGCDLFSIVNSS